MKKINGTFKLNPTLVFDVSSYGSPAYRRGQYNRYSTLFWSVFGPTDRYNFGYSGYRYAY